MEMYGRGGTETNVFTGDGIDDTFPNAPKNGASPSPGEGPPQEASPANTLILDFRPPQ